MRDLNRINSFTKTLKDMWERRVPDWRFGQFMSNFMGYAASETLTDVFYIEDERMLELLLNFFNEGDKSNEHNMEVSTD